MSEMSPSPLLALWEPGPLDGLSSVIHGMSWTGLLEEVGCVLFFSKDCKYRADLHSPCQ